MDEKWMALIAALVIAVVSAASYAKPAEESPAWVNCQNKVAAWQERIDAMDKRVPIPHAKRSCSSVAATPPHIIVDRYRFMGQWHNVWESDTMKVTPTTIDTYWCNEDVYAIEGAPNEFRVRLRQEADRCMAIMDAEGLE